MFESGEVESEFEVEAESDFIFYLVVVLEGVFVGEC